MTKSRRDGKTDRKALQLCHQVADTLNQVLSGECNDDVLRNLHVARVVPAPDVSQLLVIVAPAWRGEAMQSADVLGRLAAQSGHLRSEVAAAITRRKAPRLTFQFVNAPGNEETQDANSR
jgi:ribosome-binding factor A